MCWVLSFIIALQGEECALNILQFLAFYWEQAIQMVKVFLLKETTKYIMNNFSI